MTAALPKAWTVQWLMSHSNPSSGFNCSFQQLGSQRQRLDSLSIESTANSKFSCSSCDPLQVIEVICEDTKLQKRSAATESFCTLYWTYPWSTIRIMLLISFIGELLSPVLDGCKWLLSLVIVHQQLSSAAVIESQQTSSLPRIEPGLIGWEARTLPLCYADHSMQWISLLKLNSN